MCARHLLYTRLARYYDVIYRDYLEYEVPRLIDAVEEVFEKYSGRRVERVLDIACGTGGPTLELARRGYVVVGVDLHSEMVEVAREKARRMGVKVEFRVVDARRLGEVFPRESFDAATMFFSSINYMLSLDDLASLLESVKHVLRDKGVFVADTPNPYDSMYRYGLSGAYKATVWSVKSTEIGEDLVITDWREVADWLQGVIKFMRLVTIVKENGETRSYLVDDSLRLYTGLELELMARQVGFSRAETLCYSSGKIYKPAGNERCSRIMLVAVK